MNPDKWIKTCQKKNCPQLFNTWGSFGSMSASHGEFVDQSVLSSAQFGKLILRGKRTPTILLEGGLI